MAEWRAVQDAHSIAIAAVWITFSQQVTDVPWKKLSDALRDRVKTAGLTTEGQMQGIALQLRPAEEPLVSQDKNVGLEFMSLERPNRFSEKVQLTRSILRYESAAYTRWAPFKARARELLEAALGAFSENVPIERISFEYIDQFLSAREDGQRPDCSSIVNPKSPLIAARAFQAKLPWHSHCGWFTFPDDASKQLVNVDVTVGDAPLPAPGAPSPIIQIRSHLTDFFNQPDLRPLSEAVNWALCERRLEAQHQQLKTLLDAVLTPSAKQLISLTAP